VHHTIEWCLVFETKFHSPEFRDSSETRELNRGTPCPVKSDNLATTQKRCEIGYSKLALFTNRKPHTGFRSGPKNRWPWVILSNLERPSGRHHAFHTIRQFPKSTGLNSLQIDPHCLRQKCSPRSLDLWGRRAAEFVKDTEQSDRRRFTNSF